MTRFVLALLLSFSLLGCAPEKAPRAEQDRSAPAWLKTELYFGLSKPNGGTVTAEEWTRFLDQEVTPRFKAGLTVLDAAGQYTNEKGTLVKEPSKLLILIHEDTSERKRAVEEVREVYKKLFQQESVLKATSRMDVSF